MKPQPQPAKTKTNRPGKRSKRIESAVIIYEAVILVITNIIKASTNDKTGDMVQTWIFDRGLLTAPKVFGAKCERCPMVQACYVSENTMGYKSVRKAALKALGIIEGNTSYKVATLQEVLPLLSGRRLRLGAYGDPSALPLADLEALVNASRGHTGYTHFYHEIDSAYSEFLMASVESLSDEMLAQSLGYRTFRVLRKGETDHEVTDRSILCLESDKGIQCADCMLCSGMSKPNAKNIYIYEH